MENTLIPIRIPLADPRFPGFTGISLWAKLLAPRIAQLDKIPFGAANNLGPGVIVEIDDKNEFVKVFARPRSACPEEYHDGIDGKLGEITTYFSRFQIFLEPGGIAMFISMLVPTEIDDRAFSKICQNCPVKLKVVDTIDHPSLTNLPFSLFWRVEQCLRKIAPRRKKNPRNQTCSDQ